MDYSQGNRQKKEKREDSFKEKFFMGGGIIMWTIVKEIDRKKRKGTA